MPQAIREPWSCQRTAAAIPDIVEVILEIPGAEVAVIQEDLVAIVRAREVLVHDAAEAGHCACLHPDRHGQRIGIEHRAVGDIDEVTQTTESEGAVDLGDYPCGNGHQRSRVAIS